MLCRSERGNSSNHNDDDDDVNDAESAANGKTKPLSTHNVFMDIVVRSVPETKSWALNNLELIQ